MQTWRESPTLVALIIFLAVVGFLSASTASVTGVAIWSESTAKVEPAKLELFKVSLQVLLVVVLGTTASVLVAEFNRRQDNLIKSQIEERQKRESRRERARLKLEARRERERQELEALTQYQRTLMERLTHSYSESKKARRLLRARALRSTEAAPLVRAAEYDQLMQEINEVQLDLEEVCKELERTDAMLPNKEAVVSHVKKMEKYLSRLIHEYENKLPQFIGDPPSFALANLPKLTDLLNPHSKSSIEEELIRPYYAAITALAGSKLITSSRSMSTAAPNPAAPADQKALLSAR